MDLSCLILGLGTRCLQFQYNIVSGTLNVELGTGERLWTGKRRAQGYSTAVVALNNINDATEVSSLSIRINIFLIIRV